MSKLNILSNEKTVEYILQNKCSVARFGDGEISLMLGGKISFQKADSQLQKKLQEVCTTDKCLTCLPDFMNEEILRKDVVSKQAYKFWKKFLTRKQKIFISFFDKNSVLGSAQISRFYMDYLDHSHTKEYVELLKQIWKNRNIIFVEGCKSCLGIGNDLFASAKSIKRILCPAKNAFDRYDEIVSAIKQTAKKDDLIICALGPTATVLAYELSNEFQVLDLGHVDVEYEWFLRNVDKKIALENKYVNEAGASGRKPTECNDKTYLSQIVKTIE